MPKPRARESEKDFVNRCVGIVIAEGTAKDGAQGSAICHSIYKASKKNVFVRYMKRFLGIGK
jgi:hypothetical protein